MSNFPKVWTLEWVRSQTFGLILWISIFDLTENAILTTILIVHHPLPSTENTKNTKGTSVFPFYSILLLKTLILTAENQP